MSELSNLLNELSDSGSADTVIYLKTNKPQTEALMLSMSGTTVELHLFIKGESFPVTDEKVKKVAAERNVVILQSEASAIASGSFWSLKLDANVVEIEKTVSQVANEVFNVQELSIAKQGLRPDWPWRDK